MREIKFRVWDENKKVMLSQIGSWYFNDEYNEVAFHMNEVTFSDHKYLKLMQYTGLKDKNGTEIYEGDILEITELSGRIGEYKVGRYTVNFDAGAYVAGNSYVAGSYRLGLVAHRAKVIGNIYEHPHLLEVEN